MTNHGTRTGVCRLAAALLLTGAMTTTVARAEPLSLSQVVAMGLERSPELGQMQARTGAAEAVRDQVRREWLPKVSVDGAAGVRRLENDARVNAGISTVNEKPLYVAVSIEQPLFDFGRRSAEGAAKAAGLRAAQKDEAEASEQVALGISKAFLQVLLQQRVVSEAEVNVATHEAIASDVQQGVTTGAMSIAELEQVFERLQLARVQLNQSQTDYAAAHDTLALLIGREDFELAVPDQDGPALPASVEEAVVRAKSSDPAVQSALARLEAASHGTDRAKSERWPTMALQGTYRYGKDFEGYRGQTKDMEGVVRMRWDAFDGGTTAARIREAGFHESEARFALGQAERSSELRARTGWDRIQSLRDRLRDQSERSAFAEQLAESYKAQFTVGRRSLLDLLDAQAALYNARVETEAARFGSVAAELSLLAQFRQLNDYFGIVPPPVDRNLYGPR